MYLRIQKGTIFLLILCMLGSMLPFALADSVAMEAAGEAVATDDEAPAEESAEETAVPEDAALAEESAEEAAVAEDAALAEEAAEEGEKQLVACRKLALDLSGLSYVSSAGLRTILKLAGGAEQAGKSIVIISSEGMVREILEMARLDLFITIHDSVDDLKNV